MLLKCLSESLVHQGIRDDRSVQAETRTILASSSSQKYQWKRVLKRVLDVGCGTGRLTERLAQHFSIEHLLGLDLAPGMITYAKEHHNAQNIRYMVGDIEEAGLSAFKSLYPEGLEGMDLIFSNAALHWVNDFSHTLGKLKEILTKTGIMAFSFYLDGTYKELERARIRSGRGSGCKNNHGLTVALPSFEAVKTALAAHGFKILDVRKRSDALTFKNFRDFHHYQHRTGARNDRLEKVFSNRAALTAFIKTLESGDSGAFQLTVNVGFFIATVHEK